MMRDHPKQAPVGLPTRVKHDGIVELTDKSLAEAAGGLVFSFKLVAVKTVSWAHDDESPKN